jgi:Zn-dependent protease with chaperone function
MLRRSQPFRPHKDDPVGDLRRGWFLTVFASPIVLSATLAVDLLGRPWVALSVGCATLAALWAYGTYLRQTALAVLGWDQIDAAAGLDVPRYLIRVARTHVVPVGGAAALVVGPLWPAIVLAWLAAVELKAVRGAWSPKLSDTRLYKTYPRTDVGRPQITALLERAMIPTDHIVMALSADPDREPAACIALGIRHQHRYILLTEALFLRVDAAVVRTLLAHEAIRHIRGDVGRLLVASVSSRFAALFAAWAVVDGLLSHDASAPSLAIAAMTALWFTAAGRHLGLLWDDRRRHARSIRETSILLGDSAMPNAIRSLGARNHVRPFDTRIEYITTARFPNSRTTGYPEVAVRILRVEPRLRARPLHKRPRRAPRVVRRRAGADGLAGRTLPRTRVGVGRRLPTGFAAGYELASVGH